MGFIKIFSLTKSKVKYKTPIKILILKAQIKRVKSDPSCESKILFNKNPKIEMGKIIIKVVVKNFSCPFLKGQCLFNKIRFKIVVRP